MYLKVKQRVPGFTFKFWTDCVSSLPVLGQKCEEIGSSFFSTIVRVRTLQRLYSIFLLKKGVGLHICQIYIYPRPLRKYEAIRASIILEFIFSTPQIKLGEYRAQTDLVGHYKSSGHEIWKSECKLNLYYLLWDIRSFDNSGNRILLKNNFEYFVEKNFNMKNSMEKMASLLAL